MDDRDVVSSVLSGNPDSYALLVQRYHRQLYYYVAGKIASDVEAEDIVQKTFVTAYRELRKYDPAQNFAAWLRGVALNHCRNEWKRVEREARFKHSLIDRKRMLLNEKSLEEETSTGDDRATALRACLQGLSPGEQQLVQLRFVHELPLNEMGASLGKEAEAVRLSLFRLRMRLRSCVQRRMQLQG